MRNGEEWLDERAAATIPVSTAGTENPGSTPRSEASSVADLDETTAARMAASAERVNVAPADATGRVKPFDLNAASVARMLNTEPPPRRYLVDDFLPLPVVGIDAAPGGTGKSFKVLQLGVSVCTGLPWLGMPISETGQVLIISAEDDHEEIHRRLHIVKNHYRDNIAERGTWDEARAAIRDRLYVVDRVGHENRMTATIDREAMRTRFADCVIATAEQLSDIRLIVLDPLSRFDGGDPNDNADGTRLIECAESIRTATGATVLILHHVAKAAIRQNDAGQEAVRGASGLVDGARWVSLMTAMRAENAAEYGVDEERAHEFVRFTLPKANNIAPWPGMWLRKDNGGVLVPANLRKKKQERKEQKADMEYRVLCRRICALLERKGPMPKRRIEEDYGGTTNTLKAGQRKVRNTVARAIEEGALVIQTTDKGRDVIGLPGANLQEVMTA